MKFKKLVSILIIVFFSGCVGAGTLLGNILKKNNFTGSYLKDGRPNYVEYLSLTQSNDRIYGFILVVTPSDNGQTKSENYSVHGNVNDNAVTLIIDNILGDLTINGYKKNESIILVYPEKSGVLVNAYFNPIDSDKYNAFITQWKNEVFFAFNKKNNIEKLEKQNQEIIKNENNRLIVLSNDLFSDINSYSLSGIPKNAQEVRALLEEENKILKDLERGLSELKRDAAVRPMTCFQAYKTVGFHYDNNLRFIFNQNLGFSNKNFHGAVSQLESRILNSQPLMDKTNKKSNELALIIKDTKHALPKLKAIPGDEVSVLKNYQMLVDAASKDLTSWKAANSEIVSKAKEIMREGDKIFRQASALVNCNQ